MDGRYSESSMVRMCKILPVSNYEFIDLIIRSKKALLSVKKKRKKKKKVVTCITSGSIKGKPKSKVEQLVLSK
jgi:hypothetical protein